MASTILAILVLSGSLFLNAFADNCDSYFTSSGVFKTSQKCPFFNFCCGSCNDRYCCSDVKNKLDDDSCIFNNSEMDSITIGSAVVSVIIIVILIIVCCVCPCCCLYKLCRKPRPVMATHTTTVISSQYPQQQPSNPGGQYLPYQSIPAQPGYSTQPGYGGQPAAPYQYQGQPYTPGPPPAYNESVGTGYPAPYSQAAYDGGQPPYPLQPPAQPGYPQPGYPQPPAQPGYPQPPAQSGYPQPPADSSGAQLPYNPAYVEPPKTGY